MITNKAKNTCLLLVALSTISTNVFSIEFSNQIKDKQVKLLKDDLTFFKSLKFKNPELETQKIMPMNSYKNEDYVHWLNQRVKYVIAKDELNLKNYLENVELSSTESTTDALFGPVILMVNPGTILYMEGKNQNKKIFFPFTNNLNIKKKIEFTSPRTGLIQIGEGLFSSVAKVSLFKNTNPSDRIVRMQYFFHEARHSDGNNINNNSLGFLHTQCPKGHTLENAFACDANANGPYSIGAQMFVEMTKACDECKPSHKEELKLFAIEQKSRVLDLNNYLDDSPEYRDYVTHTGEENEI